MTDNWDNLTQAALLLDRLLKRHALNPHRVQQLTEGAVSASSVRSWLKGRARPRPNKLLALARLLGTRDGPTLFRAFGQTELAEALEEELADHAAESEAPTATVENDDAANAPTLSPAAQELINAFAHWLEEVEDKMRRTT